MRIKVMMIKVMMKILLTAESSSIMEEQFLT